MKKFSVLMLFIGLTFIGNNLMAQEGSKKAKKEEMKAKKIAFITEKLALTADESEKFWALHNEMDEKIKANHKTLKEYKPGKDKKLDDMSDVEVKALLDKGYEVKEKDLAIQKEYNDKFIQVIGVKRTAKYYHLKKQVKKQIASKGKPGQGPPNGQK